MAKFLIEGPNCGRYAEAKTAPAQSMIAAGSFHIVGLKADGTAVAVGETMIVNAMSPAGSCLTA